MKRKIIGIVTHGLTLSAVSNIAKSIEGKKSIKDLPVLIIEGGYESLTPYALHVLEKKIGKEVIIVSPKEAKEKGMIDNVGHLIPNLNEIIKPIEFKRYDSDQLPKVYINHDNRAWYNRFDYKGKKKRSKY